MFRTSRVHHQEDHLYMQCFMVCFFMLTLQKLQQNIP